MTSTTKTLKPKWIEPEINKEWQQEIIKEFNIHPVVAEVLCARNFDSLDKINAYLYAKLPNLIDPSLFAEMDKAVKRILEAKEKKESILVYGDNDVDGITGATLLTEFFRYIGIDAHFYIPNRNGTNQAILSGAKTFALENKCTLLVTVDCGITAGKEVEKLFKDKIDVIITDHHEPTESIPHCVATLNPKLVHNTYANRDLTGVGVAFKLAHAVANTLIKEKKIKPSKVDLKRYLDLVALGTIADMGALVGENRVLVRYGLKQLNANKRMGLNKLLSVCELDETETTTTDIASKVAPRLNSLGRIADPMKGVELLLLRDEPSAEKLANELDLNNMERQKIEKRDTEDIEEYIHTNPQILSEKAIVLHSTKWHPGIIPIITARISKYYNRPVAIISIENGVGKGSLRTIPEYLLPVLRQNSDLLINYGGHDFAAGLIIEEKNIPSFKERFIETINQNLQTEDLIPKLKLDSKVSFDELTFDFLESLKLLEPFGTGNPAPVFYCEAKQTWPPKIVGKSHLKLYLEQNDRVLEGIAFGLAERRGEILKKNIILRIAFTPYVNTFLNKSSIQLLIKDFKEV